MRAQWEGRIWIPRRLFRKTVQQGRSERRGESYSVPYGEPLSDARTPLADFLNSLLTERHHAVQRHLRPLLLIIRHDDVVDHMTIDEVFQRPTEMRGIDPVHGRALADRG